MIFIDATEGRPQSRLPKIANAQYVQGLEDFGPDIMISPVDIRFPADKVADFFMKKHLDAGAILVQLKVGSDMLASITDGRLDMSISRMQQAVTNSWQRWLLYVGNFTYNQEKVFLDGKPTNTGYWELNGALSAWCESGGSVSNLASPDMIPKWLNHRLTRLNQYIPNSEKIFIPKPYFPKEDSDSPLRQPKPITDARLVLAAFPGIGPDKATSLFNHFNQNGAEALCFLSDPVAASDPNKPVGIGPKTISQAREVLGLKSNQRLIVGQDKFPITIEWPPHFSNIVCSPGGQWQKREDGTTIVSYNNREELQAVVEVMTIMKEVETERQANA